MLSLLLASLLAWADQTDNRFLILKDTFARALQTASLTDLDLAGSAPREKTCWIVSRTGEVQPFSLLRIEHVTQAAGPLLPEKRDVRAAGLYPQDEASERAALEQAFDKLRVAFTSIELQLEIGEGARDLFGAPAHYKLRKFGEYTLFEVRSLDGRRRPPHHYGYCHLRVNLSPKSPAEDFAALHSQ